MIRVVVTLQYWQAFFSILRGRGRGDTKREGMNKGNKTAAWVLIFWGVFFGILPVNISNALEWNISTIDSVGDVGKYTSIAIDSNKKVHISYVDVTNGDLKYATNESGSWVTTNIDNVGSRGGYLSIAIDSNNRPHISYNGTSGLKYATNASGSWAASTISADADYGSYTSIAIDSNNKVHISYINTTYDLKYATNTSGSWVTSIVDNEDYLEDDTSIAIDSNNKVHIVYYNWSTDNLKYATNASGSWVKTNIDTIGYISSGVKSLAIAIDLNNKIHISYYDHNNYDLKYATNASGSWSTLTIDSSGDVGEYSSIAIDSNNKVHISYYDYTNRNLKYATNLSGSWVRSIVDSTGDVGSYTSMDIDSNNKIHISYYDVTNGNLKYAITATTTPITYTLIISVNPAGAGTVTLNPAGGTYNAGTVVTLTAVANSGYTFGSWGGDLTGSTNPTSITMNGNKNVTANFSQVNYTLNLYKSGNGSVKVNGTLRSLPWSGTFSSGSAVQLEAVPDTGWSFSYWSGDLSGSTNPTSITMNGNKSVTANFNQVNYTLSLSKSGNGSVKVNGTLRSLPWSGTFSSGSVAQLEAVPDTGWSFSYWSGDLSGSTNPTSITMNGNKGVTANFSSGGTATRDLPGCYTPSVPLSVSITVTPSATTQTYAVEETPPNGWTVSNINENGYWDNFSKKVKWGSFFDHNNRTLTYNVTPPSGETGTETFSGTVRFDGTNVTITGDLTLEKCATCSNLPVRRAGGSYYGLQDAYSAAVDGDTIQSQAVVFFEDLDFNRNISVTITGGYDCDYSTNDQKSVVDGTITIRNGTVTLENIIIR